MCSRHRLRDTARLTRAALCACLSVIALSVAEPVAQNAGAAPGANALPVTTFIVESYYKIRWGGEDEFMELFRKNHLPFLRRQLEKGIVLDVRFEKPREHMPEESRWDLRMTLVYRDAATAYRTDNISEADYGAIVKDKEAEAIFEREERRRFELLVAHWDVNVQRVELLLPK